MRLLIATIRNNIQQYDEGRYNQEFPIKIYLQTADLCSQILREPIPDETQIEAIHRAYTTARYQKNTTKERRLINTLKNKTITLEPYIKKTLKKYEDIDTTENNRPEVYNKHRIGVLAYEEEGI